MTNLRKLHTQIERYMYETSNFVPANRIISLQKILNILSKENEKGLKDKLSKGESMFELTPAISKAKLFREAIKSHEMLFR